MPLLALEPFVHPEELLLSPSEDRIAPEQWWVLHTRPRAEKALARRLLERNTPFFLPLYHRTWRNQGRQFSSHLPLFPGYLFLRGTHDDRRASLETNMVAYVLPVADQARLADDLRRVFRLITTGVALTPEDRLAPGDLVRIARGPLAGLEGKVLRRQNQIKFIVEVVMLGRAVSAELENWMLEPSDEAPEIAPRRRLVTS